MSEVTKIDHDYVAKLRKESTTLTHLYSYPILKEVSDLALSVYFISYIATLSSKLILDFKTGVLDEYFKFVVDYADYLDKLFDTYFLGNVDQYLPLIKTTQLKDLYPSTLASKGYSLIIAKYEDLKKTSKPIVVEKSNPILAPVNKNYESLIDAYLPKKSTTEQVSDAITKEDSELAKSYHLLVDTYERSVSLISGQVETVKQYPTKITSIYNEELSKNDQSVPKALANTSLELSNKTLSNLGFKVEKAKATVANGTNGTVPVGA